jgi:hypothetical protein
MLSLVFEECAFFGLTGSIMLLRQQAILKSGSPNVDTTEAIQESIQVFQALPSIDRLRLTAEHHILMKTLPSSSSSGLR